MAAFTRRQYRGAAQPTTITSALDNSATSITIAANTGWPSTAEIPFYVVIDPGTGSEEKCSATISGTTLTLTRGIDDTIAVAHNSGAVIHPVFTANDADEANEVVSKLTTKGDLLTTDGTTLNRLPIGSNNSFLVANSASTNGMGWGTVDINELSDVTLTSPANGDFLKYNGSAWVNDPINLGTDTTGDYVQSLTAGTGVTLSGNSGEGATPTIAIGQAVATNSNVTFNDVTVSGNLTVSGTTTTINTETVAINDNIIVLNNNATGAPSEDAGIEIERGSSTNVALRWNESTDAWQITSDGTTYDDIATAADIDEVAIDSLDDIGDVTITSAANGDALVWNGSAWVNDTIAGGATVSPSAPASPSEGDLWFDTESGLAFVRLSSAWVEIGGPGAGANVAVSSVAPASPSEGDLWFDSDIAATFVYYDSVWVEVGASGFAAVVSDSEPSNPDAGQLWFNSTDGGTYIYYDSVWVEIGAAPFNELLATIDAKGDLLVGTANDTIDRLAVGTNGQLLSANSATATGLEWTTPAYAPTASPTFTGTVTLPSATSIGTVTSTEIGYLDGVTSSIQTQLDTKASTGKAIAMSIVFGG
jgi:hypothetical protein